MAVPSTVDDYLGLVRKSGLVEPQRLDACVAKLREAGAFPTEPKKLATILVRQGMLTRFYAEQFLRGVYRGFQIGKYQILEKIGSGGMGIVYLGQHKILGHRVAIKVLPLALAKHPWFLKRFHREAQAVAALNHPNIVRAHDMDQDGNLHFLVMEFVDGSSLQDIVGKYGPMDVLRASHYVRQAAQGLQHVHEVGLIHRDIKPGNLLLDRQGVIKILDLGLARFFRDTQKEVFSGRPHERAMVGTDDYLAPEQIVNSDEVDIRADIYSLGATFYFLLTGNSPFETEDHAYQKLLKHLAQRPKAIRELRPQVPAALATLVEKMMAKNPWERFQHPDAVVDALAAWTSTPIPAPPTKEMFHLCPALRPQEALEESKVSAGLSGITGRGSSRFEIGSSGSVFFIDPIQPGKGPRQDPTPGATRRADDTRQEPPANHTRSNGEHSG
jgi:serine/threonine protein kinase